MDNVPVRINNQASASRNTSYQSQTGQTSNNVPNQSGKHPKKIVKKVILGVILAVSVAVVVLAGLLFYRSSVQNQIDTSKYQAVFFTNGQVYFGKLQQLSGGYFKLTDIFYLQAPADTTAESENPQATDTQQASDVQLIKLGSEVHGPEDEMIMNQDQILFFENLKKDGKVTDSINKYSNQKK